METGQAGAHVSSGAKSGKSSSSAGEQSNLDDVVGKLLQGTRGTRLLLRVCVGGAGGCG